VPPGHYYLRIEPESDPGRPISYGVTVTQDVPVFIWLPIAAGLLLVPALLVTRRSMNFEHLRWQESDHASSSSSSLRGVAGFVESIGDVDD
jgi:hypothetical protein